MHPVDLSCFISFTRQVGSRGDNCAGEQGIFRGFSAEARQGLLDSLNAKRRTVAKGEQEGQPQAANMRKLVVVGE